MSLLLKLLLAGTAAYQYSGIPGGTMAEKFETVKAEARVQMPAAKAAIETAAQALPKAPVSPLAEAQRVVTKAIPKLRLANMNSAGLPSISTAEDHAEAQPRVISYSSGGAGTYAWRPSNDFYRSTN